MTQFIDPERGGGKLADAIKPDTKKVLIVFWHGVGDVVMFQAPLHALRARFPWVRFDVGLCRGLDEEVIIADAVLLGANWKEEAGYLGYDIVFPCHFPVEKADDLEHTKAEISCTQELGIEPVSGHLPIKPKPLVAVHFQMTSVPWVASADEPVAKAVWDDIIAAGCVPMETLFEHVFHNPVNKKFDFVNLHMRGCQPKLESLISILGACHAFVGVVSGNFHLALSILGPKRVLLLEKGLKRQHFTKHEIATASLIDYKGEVRQFLEKL